MKRVCGKDGIRSVFKDSSELYTREEPQVRRLVLDYSSLVLS